MSVNHLIKTAQSNTKRGGVASGNNAVMPLDAIKPRDADTRPLNFAHVEALAESIAALGLIEPLAVDKQGRLLAGGHRLAAIVQLKEADLETFNQHFTAGVPVRVMEFDAEAEPARALEIEIAEIEMDNSADACALASAQTVQAASSIPKKVSKWLFGSA